MTFAEFSKSCREISKRLYYAYFANEYLNKHIVRFYETYKACAALLKPQARLLSLGAGPGYIEILLNQNFGTEISVIDTAQAIESYYQPDYVRFGFNIIPLELSQKWSLNDQDKYDMVLSGEVMEHLNIPPKQHVEDIHNVLLHGGYLILSTPNLGSLDKIIKLMRGQPIMPLPEAYFSPMEFANLGVHRREYVASEVESAIAAVGMQHISTRYLFNRENNFPTLASRLRKPFYILNPRFKPTMLFTARGNH
jgi:SAM-dependent methyltransferase